MASTTLADYQVLSDDDFELQEFQDKKLDFQVPSDFAFEAGARKPILAFKIRLFENDTAFKVFVNNREVIHQTGLDTSHTRAWWEAFSAKEAFPEGQPFPTASEIKITVTRGRARFSDVVIWYQIKRDG